MARITKANLDYQFKALGKLLGWRLPGNVGRYGEGAVFLEKWSPGDGTARYRIVEIVNVSGGESELMGTWFGIAEAHAALMAAVAAVQICKARPGKLPASWDRPARKTTTRNPVKKRRSATSRKRKAPRTAAQKRAIKIRTRTPAQKRAIAKLVALNKRRAKKKKPARKKRPLTPAQRRALKVRKTARRASHGYVIGATVKKIKGRSHLRFFTGKGFATKAQTINHPPKRYTSEASAKKDLEKILPRLPASIDKISIVKL